MTPEDQARQHDIDVRLHVLEAAVKGDGTLGHNDRIGELETWRVSHSDQHANKIDAKLSLAKTAIVISICSFILASLQILAKVAGWW